MPLQSYQRGARKQVSDISKIKVNEPIPSHWSALIGDIFHNLRSALDNLAIDLLPSDGEAPSKTAIDETYFPIGKTKSSFEKSLGTRLRRVSPKVQRVVERLKPYQGGIDAFWIIHRINILDKHICLLPSAFCSKAIYSADQFVDTGDGSLAASLNAMDEGIRISFDSKHGLKNGDVLGSNAHTFEIRRADHGIGPVSALPVDARMDFSFEISFGEGQVVDNEPVVPVIEGLIHFTERVINLLERCSV